MLVDRREEARLFGGPERASAGRDHTRPATKGARDRGFGMEVLVPEGTGQSVF